MGVSSNTVRSALAADGPPKYQRAKSGSIVDVVEPRIRELLHEFPTMPATVIAERIGWDRSIRTLSTRSPNSDRSICRRTRLHEPRIFPARSLSATSGSLRSLCRSITAMFGPRRNYRS